MRTPVKKQEKALEESRGPGGWAGVSARVGLSVKPFMGYWWDSPRQWMCREVFILEGDALCSGMI